MDHDITNLVCLLEYGPVPRPDYSSIGSDYEDLRTRALRGSEAGADHANEWLGSGRVVDSETKQPVPIFQVTPGSVDSFDQTTWNKNSLAEGANGVYQVYVSQRFAQPVLKVEAEGYLPMVVTLLAGETTNQDFVLKHGSGPEGVVVTPEGKPAAGATVILLDHESNQASLNSAGDLTVSMGKSVSAKTDASGYFAFKPQWGKHSLVTASAEGFAVVSLETLATNSTITLGRYGKITGTLKRASRLGTNEVLGLSFAGKSALSAPGINLQHLASVDGRGNFEFDRVPPGHLQIWARQQIPGNLHSWTSEPLQEVDLNPARP